MNDLSKYLLENCKSDIFTINEGIRNRDIDAALQKISAFLKKRRIYTIPAIECETIDGNNGFAVICYNDKNNGCAFVWSMGDTQTLESLLFTSNFDQVYSDMVACQAPVWDVQMMLKGASVVRSLQLVADVMSGRIGMDKGSINKAVRDAQIWESEKNDEEVLTEAQDDPIIRDLERRKFNVYQKLKDWQKKGKDTTDLQSQYDQLKAELADARVSVRANVKMSITPDPAIEKIVDRFEDEVRATPKERFEDMEAYIQNVILGIDTSVIICGAPGVGKTFRVTKKLKSAGFQRGIDYDIIKGKCTPLVLYTMMHDYQERRQLLVIDDADDIIKDETSVNLIKAATDSSDERFVSYGSSAAPIVPEEKVDMYDDFEQDAAGRWRYPRTFEYEGGMIILTNMNAGQLDTAMRSRALICDLNFTTQEVLDLVRSLSPHIAPETLTEGSKTKALEYLQKLADENAPMDINIRSFILVAKMYLSDAPEAAIQRRIREQMKLKFARGGKRY